MKKFLKHIIVTILTIVIVLTLGFSLYSYFILDVNPIQAIQLLLSKPEEPSIEPINLPPPAPVITPEKEKPELHIQTFATERFGPDDDRMAYESGKMILKIPRLDYEGPVLSLDLDAKTMEYKSQGLDEEQLNYSLMADMDTLLDEGIVLFNQSLLPGPENRNVSIAGHRDFKGMEFYYIDRITTGDQLYLDYDGKTYVYEYDRTFITNDTDWSPIAISDKSQLTLQSCDPILAPNLDYDRIFVVAYLVDII